MTSASGSQGDASHPELCCHLGLGMMVRFKTLLTGVSQMSVEPFFVSPMFDCGT